MYAFNTDTMQLPKVIAGQAQTTEDMAWPLVMQGIILHHKDQRIYKSHSSNICGQLYSGVCMWFYSVNNIRPLVFCGYKLSHDDLFTLL